MYEPIPVARSYDSVTPEGVTRPIIVGYDGSVPSRHALAYAAGMARRMDRVLVLAHIRPTPACYALDYGWSLPAEDPAELLDWLRAELVNPSILRGWTSRLSNAWGMPLGSLLRWPVRRKPMRLSSVHPGTGCTASPDQCQCGW